MLTRFVSFIIFLLSVYSSPAKTYGISIDHVTAKAGDTVCVPVRASGDFSAISMLCKFSWDGEVLKYHKTQKYFLAGLSSSDFSPQPPAALLLSWASPFGCVTRADITPIFETCFILIGQTGSTSPIFISPCAAFSCFFPSPIWVTDSGSVTISSTSAIWPAQNDPHLKFSLAPNPSAGQDVQIGVQLGAPGAVLVQIVDPLGRAVYAQTELCTAWENLL